MVKSSGGRFVGAFVGALLVVATLTTPAAATVADIPDDNFRACLNGYLGQAPDAEIEIEQLATLTQVTCNERDISSITGAEHLTGVTTLDLYGNQVEDLSPLAGLTSLTTLSLWENEVSDVGPLAELTGLGYLGLYSNNVSDVGPLARLTSLTELNLGDNQVSDVGPLAGLTSLTTLTLNGNQVSDVGPLARLTNLTTLSLWDNELSEVGPLAELTNLNYLFLNGNQVSDLNPLAELTNLNYLFLNGNQVSDLNPLVGLTNLTWLDLSGNRLVDVGPLAGLARLEYLDLNSNQVADVGPLHRLTGLTSLNVSFNRVSDLSGLPGLDLGAPLTYGYQAPTVPVTGEVSQPTVLPFRLPDGSTPAVVAQPGVTVNPDRTITIEQTGEYFLQANRTGTIAEWEPVVFTFTVITKERTFPDVPLNDYFAPDIEWLKNMGITTGYGDGTFGYGHRVLREEMAAFIWRVNGSPEPVIQHDFTDVPEDSMFADAISWLAQEGITTGYGDGRFGYGATVLREEMALFLYRAEDSPRVEIPHSFTDVPEGSVFADAISWMAQEGISTGYNPTTYGYGDNVLREQMAAFLHRWQTIP